MSVRLFRISFPHTNIIIFMLNLSAWGDTLVHVRVVVSLRWSLVFVERQQPPTTTRYTANKNKITNRSGPLRSNGVNNYRKRTPTQTHGQRRATFISKSSAKVQFLRPLTHPTQRHRLLFINSRPTTIITAKYQKQQPQRYF